MSEQTELLIKTVRKYPCLFDTSHEYYKNIVKKAEAWDEIAAELNITCDTAKLKWKNLRDSYIRHKKSIKNGRGQDRKYVKWPWSSHMMFLDGFCLQSRNANHSGTVVKDPRLPIPVPPTKDGAESEPLKIPLTKEKLTRGNISTEVLQNKHSRLQQLDGVDHLFLSYAETFKKFRATTQAVIKLQLATLFSQTELNELHEKEVLPAKVSRLMSIGTPSEGRDFIMKNNSSPKTSKQPVP